MTYKWIKKYKILTRAEQEQSVLTLRAYGTRDAA